MQSVDPPALSDGAGSSTRCWIVIPCYNESTRFPAATFEAYLSSTENVGFILVNDGSTDTTLQVLQGLAAGSPERVLVIDQQPNQGKAEAVRVGLLRALAEPGAYVGFLDADLATPLEAISDLVRVLDEDAHVEIVLGARVALLGRHIDRKPLRHYLGRLFATAASMVLALPVYDTQCGAKLLRSNQAVSALFATPFGSRWIFDVEMIARYLANGGNKDGIYEHPLRRWTDVGESRVTTKDFVRAVGEMAIIYRTYRLERGWASLLDLLTAPFLRYVGVGGTGTLVHYVILALVVEIFGASPAVATMVGALGGAFVNYVLNYHFTFASTASHKKTLPRFLVIAALSAGLSGAVMSYLTGTLEFHYMPAQLVCTVGVLAMGFVLNRAWTFNNSKAAKS